MALKLINVLNVRAIMLKRKRVSHYKNPRQEVKTERKILNPNKKIIAVDFDGTLVHNKYPFCENPDEELIDWIGQHRDKYTFILWTCRHGKQLNLAIDYLSQNYNLEFDLVNENAPWLIEKYGDCRKVYADYYIDDNNRHWRKIE